MTAGKRHMRGQEARGMEWARRARTWAYLMHLDDARCRTRNGLAACT